MFHALMVVLLVWGTPLHDVGDFPYGVSAAGAADFDEAARRDVAGSIGRIHETFDSPVIPAVIDESGLPGFDKDADPIRHGEENNDEDFFTRGDVERPSANGDGITGPAPGQGVNGSAEGDSPDAGSTETDGESEPAASGPEAVPRQDAPAKDDHVLLWSVIITLALSAMVGVMVYREVRG